MNVYRMNDFEWWIGQNLDSCKLAYIQHTGDPSSIHAPDLLTDEALDTLIYVDTDEDGYPAGCECTFREKLEIEIRAGGKFPRMFASTERRHDMPLMQQVPADHPLMKAWKTTESTESYKNTRKWALHEDHVDGSLWAMFEAGWNAAKSDHSVRVLSVSLLREYIASRRLTIESSIRAEEHAGNETKEQCERTALAEITALEQWVSNPLR